MLQPAQSPIPLDLPGYHARVEALNNALRDHDDLLALELCREQLSELLNLELLICLHFILLRQGWNVLSARLQALAHVCFPQRFPQPESSPSGPPELAAPEWLRNWLQPSFSPRLSVCMIVRNEAVLLPQALASIVELADEIVIVDTGSVDHTCDLARQYSEKVRLFEEPWCNDFAAARNKSLAQARGDWILVLDADEHLDTVSQQKLRLFFSFAPLGWNLFVIEQYNLSDSAQVFSVQVGRIFMNHPDLRFHGLLHELPKRFSHPWYLHAVYLPVIRLIHRGHLSEALARHRKQERNLLLDRAMAQPEYQCPYLWFQKAHVLLNSEAPDLRAARTLFAQALEISVRYVQRIPPCQGWSSAPLDLNLLYLLQCLYRQQDTVAMVDAIHHFERWSHLYETRALGGWALACENLTMQAKGLLGSVFQPGLQALRKDLHFYRQLTLQGLLDCALAEERPWLALAYLWQLQQSSVSRDLQLVEYRLCRLANTTPLLALQTLRALICESPSTLSANQILEYAFAFFSREFCAQVLSRTLAALKRLGYLTLFHHLAATALNSGDPPPPSEEPTMADLPGQWQWYELLERYS